MQGHKRTNAERSADLPTLRRAMPNLPKGEMREMLVGLLKEGDEGSGDAKFQAKRQRQRVVVATHGSVAHIFGAPCIHIFPKPPWHRYPLVHSRNIFSVLNHESVHCAIQRIFGFDESGKVNSALDHIIGMINQSKILAEVT